jgi:hypothetical protein
MPSQGQTSRFFIFFCFFNNFCKIINKFAELLKSPEWY